MTSMTPNEVIKEIIEAHGGLSLWNGTSVINAGISARGFLFTAKRRPVLNHVRVTAMAHEPRFIFHDFPSPGLKSELIGNDEVRISDSDGKVIERRLNPRLAFKGLRRLLYWDDLDFIYFAGYATWNYLVTPFLFLSDGFHFEVLEPVAGVPPSWVRLRVIFPDGLPSHCKEQIFYFDENRLLRRLDYTAEVVGGWAHAAHFCDDYMDFGGIKALTKRRVFPIFFKRPLPVPLLVGIDIHEMSLILEVKS